jgi:hypothetical protein
VEQYEDVDGLLNDIIEYEVEKPYIICPNVTFEDLQLTIAPRNVPLNVSSGGKDCCLSRSELVIIGPTAPVTFRGISFDGAMETMILLNGTGVSLSFEGCIWFANSGHEIIRIDGGKPEDLATGFELSANDGTHVDVNDTSVGNSTGDSKFNSTYVLNKTNELLSNIKTSWNGTIDGQEHIILGNSSSDLQQNITTQGSSTKDSQQSITGQGNSTNSANDSQVVAASRMLLQATIKITFVDCSFIVSTPNDFVLVIKYHI